MNTTQIENHIGPTMKVEVWSDVMCPFCYIGKRHYEAALSKFADSNDVEIVWKSFELNPEMPKQSDMPVSTIQYLSERKGLSYEQVQKMIDHVTLMAKNAGLEYHIDKTLAINSFNIHRIIQLAKTKGLGDAAEECFFRAYFTEYQDLRNTATLIELGKEIGLSETEIAEALKNDDYAYRVKQDVMEAQELGVNGVPFFVFNRRYAVSGAQPPEVFLKTLQQSFSEWRKENPSPQLKVEGGNVCTPGGICE